MWPRLLPLVAIVGCSSSSANNSPGEVNGTIRGNAYPVADSVSATLMQSAGSAAFIVMSSSTDLCLPPDAQIQHPGQKSVVIELVDGTIPTMPAAPAGPGTYQAFDLASDGPPPTKGAVLFTSNLDPQCGNNADDQTAAVSGSVTLTSVGGGVYTGTFDVVLDSGDHITGSFHPTMCDQLQAELASDTVPACTP